MKITEIRRKKESKKKELEGIKEDFKTVTKKQWIRFSIVALFIIIITTLLLINNNDSDVYNPDCVKANSCVENCLSFYEDSSDNHSLECNYKCLTYKYCEDS